MPPERVTVLSRGWHTEIAIPSGLLSGGLAEFRVSMPAARYVMFGYGKRTFMTARADRLSEYLLGPFPGPAVIEVFGLTVPPEQAFGPGNMVSFYLPRGGAAALSAFIGSDLARDAAGQLRLVGAAGFPGSVFYAASSGYGVSHTCNDWVAQALHAAGLPVNAQGVVFSGQVMDRAEIAARRCPVAAAS